MFFPKRPAQQDVTTIQENASRQQLLERKAHLERDHASAMAEARARETEAQHAFKQAAEAARRAEAALLDAQQTRTSIGFEYDAQVRTLDAALTACAPPAIDVFVNALDVEADRIKRTGPVSQAIGEVVVDASTGVRRRRVVTNIEGLRLVLSRVAEVRQEAFRLKVQPVTDLTATLEALRASIPWSQIDEFA
jgi:hypothetical protein